LAACFIKGLSLYIKAVISAGLFIFFFNRVNTGVWRPAAQPVKKPGELLPGTFGPDFYGAVIGIPYPAGQL
jgi:hypothetical protein